MGALDEFRGRAALVHVDRHALEALRGFDPVLRHFVEEEPAGEFGRGLQRGFERRHLEGAHEGYRGDDPFAGAARGRDEVRVEFARHLRDDAARFGLMPLGGLDFDVEPAAVGAAPADGLLKAGGRNAAVFGREPAPRVQRAHLKARQFRDGPLTVADRAPEDFVVHEDGHAVLGEHRVGFHCREPAAEARAEGFERVFRGERAAAAVRADARVRPNGVLMHGVSRS